MIKSLNFANSFTKSMSAMHQFNSIKMTGIIDHSMTIQNTLASIKVDDSVQRLMKSMDYTKTIQKTISALNYNDSIKRMTASMNQTMALQKALASIKIDDSVQRMMKSMDFTNSIQKGLDALIFFKNLLLKILPLLVFVFLVTFIINLFVKPKKLVRYLGKESGIKGWIIAIVSGILSSGPIYVWYPLLKDLKEASASIEL